MTRPAIWWHRWRTPAGQALRVGRCAAAVALLLAAATELGVAQEPGPLPNELAWIGLFHEEMLGWLENENRLAELCTEEPHSLAWHRCRAEQLEPKVAVLPLRLEPRADAERRGELVLLALPGHGLRAFVSRGGLAQPFTPDLYDPDWGYGPYFHQSILAREGSWYRIPLPAAGVVWIDPSEWDDPGAGRKAGWWIETVTTGNIITTPIGDMVVLGTENRVLRLRAEQPADMWCEAGDPPPLLPWREVRLTFDQLFDPQGHLLISYKYKRGC